MLEYNVFWRVATFENRILFVFLQKKSVQKFYTITHDVLFFQCNDMLSRRINIAILIILVLIKTGWAQEKVQSVEPVIYDEKYKVDLLFKSAEQNMLSNPSEAYDDIEQALEMSINSRDEKGEANSYYILGKINHEQRQYYLAVQNFQKAIGLFRKLNNNDRLYQSYLKIADAYKANEQYNEALHYYNLFVHNDSIWDSREGFSRDSTKDDIHSSKSSILKVKKEKNGDILRAKQEIADIYYVQNQLSQSTQEYEKVLHEHKKMNNKSGVITTMNRLADISVDMDQPEEALKLYRESQQQAIDMGDDQAVSESYRNISNVYRQKGEVDNELRMRKESLDYNKNTGNIQGQSLDNYEIGNVLISQNKPDNAIEYLEESLNQSEGIENINQKGKVLKSLSKAYDKMGDYTKAYDVYRKYAATIDTINKRKERELLAYLEQTTTLSKKQQQIDFLEKDADINEKKLEIFRQEEKIQKIVVYALLAMVVLSLLTSILIYRSSMQKKRANQLLALRSLQSQMNPHFIFNALNSVNSFISINDERSANKFLTDFAKLMRLVMDNSRHEFVGIIDEINTLDLYLKLEHLRFQDKFDCEFTVEESLKKETAKIPPMLIQPYIENAIWHGLRYKKEKGTLKVEMKKSDQNLKVIIEDNGIGRNKSMELKTKHQKVNKSTALKNIKYRLQILKDVYKIKIMIQTNDLCDLEETGTKVEMLIPFLNGIHITE